ncbi:hypothetical protein MKX01_037821 [Papaver californicum]|nr:hypothetical protein MKX01_037821 [Papaver californicum]
MPTKKQRIPETLFRLYKHRARTLADACRCKGRRCLGCSGIQFLLRIDDSYEYKDLLNKCFVVLSEDSPPLTSFYPGCHWSQQQMTNSSCVIDLLSTLAWKLLLMRIGDELMVHLLRFGSIFLPHGRKDHRQVAGFPITAYHQPASIGELGTPSKRKRTTTEDENESDLICAKRSGSYRSLDSVDCNQSNHISPFLSKLSLVKRCTIGTQNQELNELPQQSLKKAVGKPVKRFRPSSWQRRRIRRQMKFTEDGAVGFCSDTQISKNDNHKQFQENSTSKPDHHAEELLGLDSEKQHAPCVHSKMCFCNMMLQASHKVAKTSEVGRNFVFYNPFTFSSLLPRDLGRIVARVRWPHLYGQCRRIVPEDLFGAPSEWRALQRNISKFIRLRRSEKFSVKQCVHGLKTSRFPFLSNKHFSKHMVGGSVNIPVGCNTAENVKITLKNKLCVLDLLALFYEVGKQDVFYYRKQNWENLTQTALTCMRERSYRLLDYTISVSGKKLFYYCRTNILFKRPFGFSKVRFCPKGKGMRALANMKAASSLPVDKKIIPLQGYSKFHFNVFKAVNNALRDLSAVLKGIQMNHHLLLGSAKYIRVLNNQIFLDQNMEPFNAKSTASVPIHSVHNVLINQTRYSETTEGELRERHTCQDVDLVENGIDDISSTPNFTISFYSRLIRGFRDYNCSINEAKSCMNFDIGSASGVPTNRIYTGKDGISFLPWSGLLLNCHTLEIQADYTRQGKPGFQMKDKLRQFLQPKCHAIFYDSQINSAGVVRLNIYQAFLLSAMKFHCYLRGLSNTCSFPADYYFEMIKSSVRCLQKLIMKRMRSDNIGSTVRSILKLKKEEVEWLGLKAYDLLSLLRSELLAHGSTRVSTALKYAINDSHSSLFWKIKY